MTGLEKKIVIREFEAYLAAKYGGFNKEVLFGKLMLTKRKFRADYQVGQNIIEINGGQWINGRHNRGGTGYENDLIKSNLAQAGGFKYFQFTYEMISKRLYKTFL